MYKSHVTYLNYLMNSANNSQCELIAHLKCMPPDLIKAAVIECLSIENSELIDWKKRLSEEVLSFHKWIEIQRKK